MSGKLVLGPRALEQMMRYRRVSEQGEHIIISGPTKSGKTSLVPELVRPRIERGGHVIVFVMKPKPDPTILAEFQGWTRWKKMKKKPSPHENRILLWPDTRGMNMKETLEHQKQVFADAFDVLFQVGNWTAVVDEGLYTVHSEFLNMSHELAMLHSIGRTLGLSLITLTQRPAHLPLIIYSSASHAFVGKTTETSDLKRLAELGGKSSAKDTAETMTGLGRHEFLWVAKYENWPNEIVDLKK